MTDTRTHAASVKDHAGSEVTVRGFAQKIRDLREVKFLIVRDRTGAVQCVVDVAAHPELAAQVAAVPREAAVSVTGMVESNPSVKLGGVEIRISRIEVAGAPLDQLPIPIFSGGAAIDLDARTDWRFLDLREPKHTLVFEMQTAAEHAMREFWIKHQFIEIHSPKLMGSPSESGAELFSLPYFETTAYLAQSPQFYKQMAMAAGFERVFEIGPVFRANPSFTSRHDTEFTSVDVEFAWVESHEDVMAFEERWLQYVMERLRDQFADRVKALYQMELTVPTLPFPRIPLADAVAMIEKKGHVGLTRPDGDLDPAGERAIADMVKQEMGHEFVFLTDYPITVRPFYHMRHADQPQKTKSFDLLWRGLEITTGAQREHRYDVLLAQAEEKGIHASSVQFYLDFFKFGVPPHGGFGFGLTRLLMLMLGLKNVREATYLYRSPSRLFP